MRGGSPGQGGAELEALGKVAIVTMFTTEDLRLFVKIQEDDVLAVGPTGQFGVIIHALP